MTKPSIPSSRLSRRTVLGATQAGIALTLGGALTGCGTEESQRERRTGDRQRFSYGPHPSQFVEISRPVESAGSARSGKSATATVVLLHGGYWSADYGLDLMRPIARDLVGRGYAVVNVEYRRVGGAPDGDAGGGSGGGSGGSDAGGFPATMADVAAAIDGLDRLDRQHLDELPPATVLVGHSAGGQLAAWAASRTAQTPGGKPRRTLRGAVSLSGVLDLQAAAAQSLGGGAVQAFLGPDPNAASYRLSDPSALVPPGCEVVAVHAENDLVVPLDQSTRYVDRVTGSGPGTGNSSPSARLARLLRVDGDHFTLIDPAHPAWTARILPQIDRLARSEDR